MSPITDRKRKYLLFLQQNAKIERFEDEIAKVNDQAAGTTMRQKASSAAEQVIAYSSLAWRDFYAAPGQHQVFLMRG